MQEPTIHRGPMALTLRFALISLVAFVLIGTAAHVLIAREIRSQHREFAEFHALFLAESVLDPELEPDDLVLDLDEDRRRELSRLLTERVLTGGVVRVKVWRTDGTILFSDEPELVGRTSTDVRGRLEQASRDGRFTVVDDLGDPDEVREESLAERAFQTFIPMTTTTPDGTSTILEVDQDTAPTDAAAARSVRTMDWILVVALLVLWAVTLPIAARIGRVLRDQSGRLREHAEQLGSLLRREQETSHRLEELNRMKSDFIAVASHELRTPLTAILGAAKTLQHPKAASNEDLRQDLLGRMDRQSERVLRLVDLLLSTDRLQRGAADVDPEPIEVRTLVSQVVRDLDPERVRVCVSPGLTTVTDRTHLFQILSNLVGNGLKYSEGSVDVGGERSDDGVRIFVVDRGVGMSVAQLEHVFEPFWQAEEPLTRTAEGVGIGLYLVKLLTEALGGRIDVESRPDRGTRVVLTLPDLDEGDGREELEALRRAG